MRYISTRGGEAVRASKALLQGLAPDGGLYIPETFPQLSIDPVAWEDASYQEIATKVLSLFFPECTEEEWTSMLQAAYSMEHFDTPDIVPIHTLGAQSNVLELWHGRTQAFKDMALSLFPHLLVDAKKKEGETRDILILTATSGDTGKAALAGFADVPGTYLEVLYPTDGVSPMQRDQMAKQLGDNVDVTAIRGNFDDAQQFLKRLFVDSDFRAFLHEHDLIPSSANSINIGRLLPQVVYYVYAYVDLVRRGALSVGERFHVVVPTGNFGNLLAAQYAGRLGVPVGMLICASNQNDVLTEFIQTGVLRYQRPFHVTESPSMDIIESSNLERFLYDVFEEDTERVTSFIAELTEHRTASLTKEELTRLQEQVFGASVDDEETLSWIRETYHQEGYLIDPHTAVALGAYATFLEEHPVERETPVLIASTAHPYKFPSAIARAIGVPVSDDPYVTLASLVAVTGVGIPKELAALYHLPTRFETVIDKTEMRARMEEVVASWRRPR